MRGGVLEKIVEKGIEPKTAAHRNVKSKFKHISVSYCLWKYLYVIM